MTAKDFRPGQFDFRKKMPRKKSEDEVKTERILMAEQLEQLARRSFYRPLDPADAGMDAVQDEHRKGK